MFEGIKYATLKEMDEIRREIKEKGFRVDINKRTADNKGNLCLWENGAETVLFLTYTDFRTAKEQANDPDVSDILEGMPKLGIPWEAHERSWDRDKEMYSFYAEVPTDFFTTEEGVEDDLPWT